MHKLYTFPLWVVAHDAQTLYVSLASSCTWCTTARHSNHSELSKHWFEFDYFTRSIFGVEVDGCHFKQKNGAKGLLIHVYVRYCSSDVYIRYCASEVVINVLLFFLLILSFSSLLVIFQNWNIFHIFLNLYFSLNEAYGIQVISKYVDVREINKNALHNVHKHSNVQRLVILFLPSLPSSKIPLSQWTSF